MQSILIVDDLESIHEMLEAVIQPIGYNTVFATDGQIALEKLRQEKYDIVLTDINMKPMDGLTLLREIKEIDPDAVVLMMSGFANVENATEALKLGAFDFLTKPFKVDQLMAAINRATEERQKRRKAQSPESSDVASILAGQSDTVKSLNDRIERHANTANPLLVIGEKGTQKASVASIIHSKGANANGPFVSIDANELDELEFYGQLFTQDGKPGPAIEESRGGSLFIENIDQVALKNQSHLGNFIRDLKGEVRFICSTNQDLENLVEAGKFEDALFFRVSTTVIEIPPLRTRSDDLSAIVMSFFGKNNINASLGEQASQLLQGYQWPGNYSELKEVLDAAIEEMGDDNVIHKDNLPEKISDVSSWPTLAEFLSTQGDRYKSQVLKACLGDSDKAAQVLGCDPSEL